MSRYTRVSDKEEYAPWASRIEVDVFTDASAARERERMARYTRVSDKEEYAPWASRIEVDVFTDASAAREESEWLAIYAFLTGNAHSTGHCATYL